MPRTTVQRKLSRLKKMGVIERRGSHYLLSAKYMNAPHILKGFRRRREIVRHLFKKLTETGR
jgi:DNA-binding IclR family transcriptional regulator